MKIRFFSLLLNNDYPFYPKHETVKHPNKITVGVMASFDLYYTFKKIKSIIPQFILKILPARQTGQLFEALKHEAPVSYHLAKKNNVCVCLYYTNYWSYSVLKLFFHSSQSLRRGSNQFSEDMWFRQVISTINLVLLISELAS